MPFDSGNFGVTLGKEDCVDHEVGYMFCNHTPQKSLKISGCFYTALTWKQFLGGEGKGEIPLIKVVLGFAQEYKHSHSINPALSYVRVT